MTRGGGHLVSHLTHATQGKLLHFLWYNSFQKFGALSFQIRALHVMKTDRSTNYRTFIGSVSRAAIAFLYSTRYLESDYYAYRMFDRQWFSLHYWYLHNTKPNKFQKRRRNW